MIQLLKERIQKTREWGGETTVVTRGWLALSVVLGFVFLGCAMYAAVQTVHLDNRITQEKFQTTIENQVAACQVANERRLESKVVALGHVEQDQAALANDRTNWESLVQVYDIPPDILAIVTKGLEDRQVLIDAQLDRITKTYTINNCNKVILTLN